MTKDILEEDVEFLKHYGVKGMKWGVRKDRAKNPNYTEQQRKRDRQIYGRYGESRINRRMNKGDTVTNARGREVTRRNKTMNRNKYLRPVGKAAGTAAGATAGYFGTKALAKYLGTNPAASRVVTKLLGNNPLLTKGLATVINSEMGQASVAAGLGYIGNLLGGDILVKTNMRTAGYDPNRK